MAFIPYPERMKKYKCSVGLSSGMIKFYGDVRRKGINVPAFISFSYRPINIMELKASIAFFNLSGNDKDGSTIYIQKRNIQFKSFCQEATLSVLVYPWDKYCHKLVPYISLSGGVLHFNPKAPLDGTWYELQPLGTEGQGIGGINNYARTTGVFSVGAGTLFNVSERISLGIELNIRKTKSDYLDDVSGKYYDKALLKEHNGIEASLLSDPSYLSDVDANGNTSYREYGLAGGQRGDRKGRKDGYSMLLISVQYKF